MDRLSEMKEKLKNWIEENVKLSIVETERYIKQHSEKIGKRLMEKICCYTDNCLGENSKIALCYLRSSILDKSDEFCVFPFDDIPFVDRVDEAGYVSLPEIFRYAKEKVKDLYEEMNRNFVRVLPYEKEEMRREYMYSYLNSVIKLFGQMLQNDIYGLSIYVGEYMGVLEKA